MIKQRCPVKTNPQTDSPNGEAVLFFNTQGEPYFAEKGYTTLPRADVAGLLDGTNPVQVVECGPWEIPPQLLELYLAQRAAPVLKVVSLFCDEVHLVCGRGQFRFPDGAFDSESIIAVLASTGLRWNIRCIWISQRPSFCDASLFRTSRYLIFFTVSEPERMFFEQNGITFENPEWHSWVMVMQ
jgi:hypothetical protein